MIQDKIADCIASMKIGLVQKKLSIRVGKSNFLKAVLRKLEKEGYIRGFAQDSNDPYRLTVFLKYDLNMKTLIFNIKPISTSGRRVYISAAKLKKFNNSAILLLISTSKGLLTNREIIDFNYNIGGEIILAIANQPSPFPKFH